VPSRYGPLFAGCRALEPVTVLPQFRPQSQNTVSRGGRVREIDERKRERERERERESERERERGREGGRQGDGEPLGSAVRKKKSGYRHRTLVRPFVVDRECTATKNTSGSKPTCMQPAPAQPLLAEPEAGTPKLRELVRIARDVRAFLRNAPNDRESVRYFCQYTVPLPTSLKKSRSHSRPF